MISKIGQSVSSRFVICNLDVKSHVAPQRTFLNPELVNPCQIFAVSCERLLESW
jgi:hypothetical protein